jgi:hypothetical protein
MRVRNGGLLFLMVLWLMDKENSANNNNKKNLLVIGVNGFSMIAKILLFWSSLLYFGYLPR